VVPDIELGLVSSPEDIGAFFSWLSDQHGYIAVDTETTGLDWTERGFVRLVQFGVPGSGWAVPMEWYGKVAHDALARIDHAVMHNAKFDVHALRSAGLPVPPRIDDTMIMHRLVRSEGRHGLKQIATERLGPWANAGATTLRSTMRKNGWDWATIPVDHVDYWAYGVLDTCLTAQVYEILREEVAPYREAYDREMSYQFIMLEAERRGMRIDVEYSAALRETWRERLAYLLGDLQTAGIANPNSNRMVEAVLVDLGWAPQEYTDTGQAKLDSQVLKRLKSLGGPTGHIAEWLIEYKRLTKWTAAYLDPFVDSGGRVHPSINTMAARTGRSSITNPPLQTLPHTPDVRTAVIPEPGHVLYTADYLGQEARIFASYANEPAMIEEFLRGGDLHNLSARTVYGEGYRPEQRDMAKTVNFALLYGAGPRKMAQSAGVAEGAIKRFLAQYHSSFPRVQPFMEAVQASVRQRDPGYIITRGGRRVGVDHDKAYTGVNYLIQGSGADVLKDAVVRLRAAGLDECIVIPVHDEILFQFPERDAEGMIAEAQKIMTNDDWFQVPITTDSKGPLSNWGDAYRKDSH
jgi:DNA polymerase-1